MINLKTLIATLPLILLISGKTARELEEISNFEKCLHKDIPNAKVLIEGSEYEAANYQWNLRNPVTPLGIFSVSNKNEIQVATKCSISTNIPIVAKSGGHSYEKYSFGTGKEIIIDLHKLSKVIVDKSSETATVEAGALLGHVYYQLNKQGGFAVPAGSCPTVGIAGHTLGGGYGLSSRKHGFMIDNLLQADIILPNGQNVTTSKDSHSELFWALRGAGAGNFGIVSEFKFKLFKPPSKVTRIQYIYDFDKSEEVFKAFQKWAASDVDPSITTVASYGINGFNINSVIQADTSELREKLIDQVQKAFPKTYNNEDTIFDTDFIGMVSQLSDIELNNIDELDTVHHSMEPQLFFRAKSAYVDRELSDSEVKEWKKVIEEVPDEWLVIFDTQGGVLNNLQRNDTAFVHRHKSLYSIQLIAEFSGEKATNADESWAEVYFDRIKNYLSDESFQNYIDAKADDFYKKYYAENFSRLQRVKQKYDPKNMFKFKQSIPLPEELDQEF